MKCPGLSDIQRLMISLENSLQLEDTKWKVPVCEGGTLKGTDISLTHYEQAVLWMEEVTLRFHFYPETFGLAVSILNRILASVKAQVKYLRCITVACLFLAAKTSEEDEVIPSVKKLAVQSGCMCSSAEILRMERIVLDKLQWDLYTATPVDFLNTFHAMLMSNLPHLFHSLSQMNPSHHLALLTRQLQQCMACHHLVQFRGSTLALVIITLELEKLTADWFPAITELLKKAKVDSAKFILCKELVDQQLGMLSPPNHVYVFISAKRDPPAYRKEKSSACSPAGCFPQPISMNTEVPEVLLSARKQAEEEIMETEFYDGFRYLYNEESVSEDRRIKEMVTGKLQEASCPCPVLQAPGQDQ
ncbi:cyclin I family, member 2 L homeolog [Xenopus laevis]|uniref:Cyclin I family, member 2 L homeolog n=1 Tax=Xenopus laevis TaxID=8355 RepID=Q66IZ0_XENLA|nr:cyclin I family, member 2 L homeolog [Xenopus laevis]AAH81135.1 MGC83953 protein [Xenopus laevis]